MSRGWLAITISQLYSDDAVGTVGISVGIGIGVGKGCSTK
jgi:hypothetical protein